MRLIYSDLALRNIEDIGAYTADFDPGAAVSMQSRLRTACQSLPSFPQVGRQGRRRGTRELTTVSPYVIIYRVLSDAIRIERIVHGARRR